jgi:two-component system chemotaxis sensor kinase CheA
MKSKEEELKDIFLAEAQENQQELEKRFTELEKKHTSAKAVEAIFRITHTLKANAAGMGFAEIATMAHTMEDVFGEIKRGHLVITTELFNDLFRANDMLGLMIQGISNPGAAKVKYRGIKTKLEVVVRNVKQIEQVQELSVPPIQPAIIQNAAVEPLVNRADLEAKQPSVLLQATEGAAIPLVTQVLINDDVEIAGPKPEQQEEENNRIIFSENVHIPVRKLDSLLDLVGELIIEKDRIIALCTENGSRTNDFARLQRITSELQYSVMDVRLVQVAVLFSKFHRIVRDIAILEGKQVNLVLEGTENEIDRNILQIISDSLVHLVRNSVSHGIETEQDRVKAKKPIAGTVTLSARSEKEEVIILISDDGKGINPEIIRKKAIERGLIAPEVARQMTDEQIIALIFEPGFSSTDQVTAVSGRGVGMDVVKQSIDSIRGKIDVQSVIGKGTTIQLTLPASMAVKNVLLFELSEGAFAIPLCYTDAVISLYKKDINKVGKGLVAQYLKKNIPIVFLHDLFDIEHHRAWSKEGILHQTFNKFSDEEKLLVIIVSHNNREVGLVVDKLLQKKEIIEKPLGQLFENLNFMSGATILGKGDVCLVLDAPAILNFLFHTTRIVW